MHTSSQHYQPKSKVNHHTISELEDSRIITKNLVYVIGLSQSLASKEKLWKYEYFGQYGNIVKIVVNSKILYKKNSSQGPSYSAYVTYSKPSEASVAIWALDYSIIDNHLIRASFGTTKYCTFYLKHQECNNKDCWFLHRKANESDIIKREDLNVNRSIFYQQQLYATKIANVYNPEIKESWMQKTAQNAKSVFPPTYVIYQNEIVIENDPNFKKNIPKLKIEQHERSKLNKWFIEDDANKINNTRNNKNITLETAQTSKDEVTCPSTGDENEKNILYKTLSKSRFSFIKKELDTVAIPYWVQKIIDCNYKKITSLKYFKNKDLILFNQEEIHKELHLQTELSSSQDNCINDDVNKDNWSDFLVNNSKTSFNDYRKEKDEFAEDIDNITKFIFDKTHSS